MTTYETPEKKLSVRNVHNALKCWHDLSGKEGSLLCDMLIVQQRQKACADQNIVEYRKITNNVLEDSIEILKQQDQECGIILLKRFKEDKTIVAVSHAMNLSQDQLNRKQREAIELLTEILLSRENQIREERSNYQYTRLESQVSETVFGKKDLIKSVCEKLLDYGDPEIIVLTGLGGIGKTTIANAVAKEAISKFRFGGLVWIRASDDDTWLKDGVFSADNFVASLAGRLGLDTSGNEVTKSVRKELCDKPYLVVIDNLSTEDDVVGLIDAVKVFANPSKFMITSRRKPSALSSSYTVSIPELAPEPAKQLVLDQAKRVGLGRIIEEIADNMDSIYSLVGGIPLALKLLVGLLDMLPLSIVLQEFQSAQLEDIESVYKYIYWQSWNVLSDNAKSLLIGMVQAAEVGVTLENMRAWSGLVMDDLIKVINNLFLRSLMEWRGNIEDRRYGIHQLTLTFLQTDIIIWPPN